MAAVALGLTAAESRVAVLLAQGMSVREIAVATGRRESTIRTHVKHMFAKHEISRQADLVRLVQSLASARETWRRIRNTSLAGADAARPRAASQVTNENFRVFPQCWGRTRAHGRLILSNGYRFRRKRSGHRHVLTGGDRRGGFGLRPCS